VSIYYAWLSLANLILMLHDYRVILYESRICICNSKEIYMAPG
jgi:hypothetical protein